MSDHPEVTPSSRKRLRASRKDESDYTNIEQNFPTDSATGNTLLPRPSTPVGSQTQESESDPETPRPRKKAYVDITFHHGSERPEENHDNLSRFSSTETYHTTSLSPNGEWENSVGHNSDIPAVFAKKPPLGFGKTST